MYIHIYMFSGFIHGFKWPICICMYVIQHIIIQNNYYFNAFSKNNMNRHNNMCLFMSILHSKIKFEIDINNADLLEIVWEHMREIKRPEGEEILFN